LNGSRLANAALVRGDLDVVVGDGEAGEVAEGAADVDLDHAAAPGVRQVGAVVKSMNGALVAATFPFIYSRQWLIQ
jgi:hypothetical protein